MIFDERVKVLGFVVEMGIYRVSGILINDYEWVLRMKKWVKDLVLFGKTKRQRAEVRGQRTADRGRMTEDRGRRTADGEGRSNAKGRKMGLEEYPVEYYVEFLEYVKERYEGQYWHVLPREMARFWKGQREC